MRPLCFLSYLTAQLVLWFTASFCLGVTPVGLESHQAPMIFGTLGVQKSLTAVFLHEAVAVSRLLPSALPRGIVSVLKLQDIGQSPPPPKILRILQATKPPHLIWGEYNIPPNSPLRWQNTPLLYRNKPACISSCTPRHLLHTLPSQPAFGLLIYRLMNADW